MRTLIVFYLMQSNALIGYQNQMVDRFQAEGHNTLLHLHPECDLVPKLNVDRLHGPAPSPLLPDMLANILVKAMGEECHNIVFDLRSCLAEVSGTHVWPQELWHMFMLTQMRPEGWLRSTKLAVRSLPRIFGITDASAPWDFNDQQALHRIFPQMFLAFRNPLRAYA